MCYYGVKYNSSDVYLAWIGLCNLNLKCLPDRKGFSLVVFRVNNMDALDTRHIGTHGCHSGIVS